MDRIIVRGAREHNLKNIDVDIPKEKLVVITGPSGSGKSSLAFDTLYGEGQRRYVESLSSYARQFLGVMEKPDVDRIEGLSPAIAIDQKTTSKNPRSTVGTVTEIYDYMRVLWANLGKPRCKLCGKSLEGLSAHEILERVFKTYKDKKIMVLAPVVRGKKGSFRDLFREIDRLGYRRIKVDGELRRLIDVPPLEKNKRHSIDIVIDRLTLSEEERARLLTDLEKSLELTGGLVKIEDVLSGREELFSEKLVCPDHNFSIPELSPRLFSFNSPYGACPSCKGLGVKWEIEINLLVDEDMPAVRAFRIAESPLLSYITYPVASALRKLRIDPHTRFKDLSERARRILLYGTSQEFEFEGIVRHLERRYLEDESERVRESIEEFITEKVCPSCGGSRLREEALAVLIDGKSIWDVVSAPVGEAKEWIESLPERLSEREVLIGERLIKEISERLGFLVGVGLDYLSLSRSATTLSGGEMQRIRLATQLGSKLSGVLYVLDEPSIGLHPRDTNRLIKTLKELRDLGNTVVVVEHDPETIESADWVIELGPGAGKDGGRVVFCGTVEEMKRDETSLTGAYLSGRKEIPVPRRRRKATEKRLRIIGAKEHNLKNIDVDIPVGLLVCITGVSGSGKSTLIYDVLYRYAKGLPADVERIEGLEMFDKVINVDQSPIGRTPRSNPATYTKVFDPIRSLFASTPEARARGYKPGRFSFNVKGGRCEACQGEGIIKVEMHFLPPVYVTCDVCKGKRYNRETLDVLYKGKSISDVLDMTVDEAYSFFGNVPSVRRKLELLRDVGLGYIQLGQPAPTLSGGEAQRIKLARELAKRERGRTLYLLDEPTTGLHMDDIRKLIDVLQRLVDKGNTVVVIEHNMDVIKCADWVIDLGPEGGKEGGEIVAMGTPEDIAKNPRSYTGAFLRKYMRGGEKVA